MLRLSDAAQQDLLEIEANLRAEAGQNTALKYARRITQRFEALCDLPFTGALRENLGEGRRVAVVAPYLIIYQVDPGEVLILRVAHGARDLPELMDEG